MEDLQEKGFKFDSLEFEKYKQRLDTEKQHFVIADYADSPAFNNQIWKQALSGNRYLITGFTAHGFHHHLCKQRNFHKRNSACVCRLCNESALDKNHGLICAVLVNKSLKERHIKFLTL